MVIIESDRNAFFIILNDAISARPSSVLDVPRLSFPGPHQENPLLLLGQYSDDELGEEESTETKHAYVFELKPSSWATEQV